MADYVGFLKVCRTYQALVSMRADVLFMAADRFVIAFIADLLMLVKRCPGSKRKKEHPQHSCSQHSFDMCAFLVHLHAKLNKMPFQASSLRNNNDDTAGFGTLRLQSYFYYASMMIYKELNRAAQTNMLKFTFIRIKILMVTAEQIRTAYIDYVLTHGEKPKSIYSFVKSLDIQEAEFYNHYASFESIEKNTWAELVAETIDAVQQQEVWTEYSSRDKMLSFFYSFTELLKSQRSFIVYSLKQNGTDHYTHAPLASARELFEQFAENVLNEGLESGELAERKFFTKRYKDALWAQFLFITKFWVNDDSTGFEKTDEAIEKGINVTFDLFQRSPIDNLFEYGKFLSRNGAFKEKMRF